MFRIHGLYEFIGNGHTTKCSYFSLSSCFLPYYQLVYQQTHLSQASTTQVKWNGVGSHLSPQWSACCLLRTYKNPIRVSARVSAEAENSRSLCMGWRNPGTIRKLEWFLRIITEHDGIRRIKRRCLSMREELRNQNSLSTNSITTSYLTNRIIPMYWPIVWQDPI